MERNQKLLGFYIVDKKECLVGIRKRGEVFVIYFFSIENGL